MKEHVQHNAHIKYSLEALRWNNSSNIILEMYTMSHTKMSFLQKNTFLPIPHSSFQGCIISHSVNAQFTKLLLINPFATINNVSIQNCKYIIKHCWFYSCVTDCEKQISGSNSKHFNFN